MIPDLRAPFFRQNWVRVVNGSGAVIPPHSVVLISSTSYSGGAVIHTVVQPNAASTDFNWDGYLVTGPFAIGSSSTAEGIACDLSTPGLIRYDSGTPVKGEIWGPKHGLFTVSKNYYGYHILGGNTTSGDNSVTVAKWHGVPSVVGKIDDSSVSLGATCTVSVHVGSSYQSDSGMELTGVLNRGVALTGLSSPYCKVSAPNGVPILDWVAC